MCEWRGTKSPTRQTVVIPLYFGRIWASGLGVGHGWLTAQTRCIRASDDTPGLRQRTTGQLPTQVCTGKCAWRIKGTRRNKAEKSVFGQSCFHGSESNWNARSWICLGRFAAQKIP